MVCCLAVFGGVVLARFVQLDDFRWLWLVVPFAVVSLRRQNAVTLLLLVLLFGGIGWWRGYVYMERLAVHESLHEQKVVLVGRAAEEAVYGERYQLEFTLSNVEVLEPERIPLVGSLTIRGFGEPAVYRGDIVRAEGKLFPALGNNLGRISFAQLEVVERDSFWLNDLRRKFGAGMQSALPEPAASFGMGLLIGQRNTLPEQTSEQLRHVGLTHIIAVSGYNLTIIVMACRRLLAKRSKFQATAACLALIGIFLLLAGSQPPIVRASIISLLSIGAWYYGRNVKPLVLLMAAASVTVIANPVYLWSSVSWWLSFLAFFGMLLPALAGWFAWPATAVLTFILDVANLLSRVPNAFVENIGFPLTYMIILYAILAYMCFVLWSKTRGNVIITEKIREQNTNVRSL